MDQPSAHDPEGIKGAGECDVIGSIPAIVAAVEDALQPFGLQRSDLPLRPPDLVPVR
jgi:aerobic carbon-monoxide dehydrogenase large subunit